MNIYTKNVIPLEKINQEQIDKLNKQSQEAYNAEIKGRQTLLAQVPALEPVLNQKVPTESLCGCGCQQVIGGYFGFQGYGCMCSCAPHAETVYINSSLCSIGPNAPSQGALVNFVAQVTGTGNGNNIHIPLAYLQGTVPDAENLIGVQMTVQLLIHPGSIILTLIEGCRVLASLVHYDSNISGQFLGTGTGMFQLQ